MPKEYETPESGLTIVLEKKQINVPRDEYDTIVNAYQNLEEMGPANQGDMIEFIAQELDLEGKYVNAVIARHFIQIEKLQGRKG